MAKLTYYEFTGSWLAFWLLMIVGITIPLGILYLIQRIARVEHEVDNPEEALARFRSGGRER